jgi:hypothetical protein
MKDPTTYSYSFIGLATECREEGASEPPPAGKAPDTLTMPKIVVGAEEPSDAPLAPPRGSSSGLTSRASHVELIVPPADLEEDGGQRFLVKMAAVIAEHPATVVVNLLSGPPPSQAAIGILLRTRAEAKGEGVRLVVRPVAPAQREHLRELGVAELLGL